MRTVLALLALCAHAAAQEGSALRTTPRTCADKVCSAPAPRRSDAPVQVAAGDTAPCVAPYAFPAGAVVNTFTVPAVWSGPFPVCYAQYYQNQARVCVST